MPPSNLIIVAIFFVFLTPIPTVVEGQQEQSDIITALLTLQKALGGKTNSWNRSTAPCSWKGIRCVEGEVTEIRLPGGSLIGTIPEGVFGTLTSLRALSIHDNALLGPLPSDLASCVQLRYLYLHRNRFEGDISVLGSLKSLVNLDISENRFSSDNVSTIGSFSDLENLNLGWNGFSGNIPESFRELRNLQSLLLENNNFSGVIPDLDLLNLKSFNVSYNNLTGSIPNKLRFFPATSFLGMSSLCGGPLQSCGDEKEKKDKLSTKQLIGIIVPCILSLLILLFILLLCCLRRRKASQAKQTDLEGSSAANTAPRRSVNSNASTGSASSKVLVFFDPDPRKKFDLEELLRASAEVLGKGTFGTTYKALLEQGFIVAVKRLRGVDSSDATAFKAKIEALGKMVHPNLVPLRAYYNSRDETLFIYDFMHMGSLSARLHGTRGSGRIPFNWEERLGVAIGSASGIAYIHSTGATASHGNIKTSNILLSEECNAHISDNGLSQFASDCSAPSRVPGYQAAEVTDTRRVSQKADVYSFGIVLLELLTCKAPVMNDECRDLPRWVKSMRREEWFNEVFDAELLRDHTMEDEMIVLLEIGLDCTEQHPDMRPTMPEVLSRIQAIRSATMPSY